MAKVKVHVQLLVTGGVGDGKTAITHRILKAIQADQGLQSICKLHPGQSYEILRGELTRLTFTGELKQNAEMKKPSAMYSEVPGYPNADEMLSYLTSVINETELSKAMKQHEESTVISHTDKSGNRTEYKPFKVVIDTVTGQMVEWRAGEKLSTRDRVITLLADASSEPVGMHQDDVQTAEAQPAAGSTIAVTLAESHYAIRTATTGAGKEYVAGFDSAESGKDRTASVTIQDGRVQGVASMERLAGETDTEYRNRNKLGQFIVIPAYVPIAESAAPTPDAHKYPLAVATLESLIQGFASKFKEHDHVPYSVLKGDFWLIMADGSLFSASDYQFQGISELTIYRHIPVYYAER